MAPGKDRKKAKADDRKVGCEQPAICPEDGIRFFVDLDGTLVDFKGSVQMLGEDVHGDQTAMWDAIASAPKFWRSLPWLPDGQELWKELEPLRPVVLTGLPSHNTLRKRAEDQKRAWCREHLGPSVEVICVASKDKARYSGLGHVLVDDDQRHRDAWEKHGGHFVTRADVKTTMQAVQAANASVGLAGMAPRDAELAAVFHQQRPADKEQILRAQVAASVRKAIDAASRGCFVAALVGSSGSGLASSCSDMDFALVPLHGATASLSMVSLESVAKVLESDAGMCDAQVIVTRAKAPDVIKCTHSASGIQCDIVAKIGPNGAFASVDKCALLREFSSGSPHFKPLALLVKQWAKARHLVDPAGRKLNSFTFTLMVAFFLQVNELLSVPDLTPQAIQRRRQGFLALGSEVGNRDSVTGAGIASLLRGFFTYWRQFQFRTSSASVRCGQCCGFVPANLQTYNTDPVFMMIDPVEPDENTARTLGSRNLEEVRAELNRASTLMQQDESWDTICEARAGKKTRELKDFYLPSLSSVRRTEADDGSNFMRFRILEILQEVALTDEVRLVVEQFVREAPVGEWTSLAHRVSGAERRALQKLADACDMEVRGKCEIELLKGSTWAAGAARPAECAGLPPPWTDQDREQLLESIPSHSANVVSTPSAAVADKHSLLKTVKLLRQGMTLESLQTRHKLIVKKHPQFDIVQLSYNQTESQMSSPVVQECRGLILEARSWNIVASPFTKFFNHGETNAKALDWAGGVRVHEKLDGSIMVLYWYQNAWHVASSKLPAGDGLVPDGGSRSFAEVFWEVWNKKCYTLPSERNACYMFELLLPSHTIVVRHQDADLICIGGRSLETLIEIPCEEAGVANGWDTPRRFDYLCDLDSVLAAARLLNPVDHEGFVAVDRHWNRLKIKSASYVALHHLSGNACWRRTSPAQMSNSDRKACYRSLIQIARYNEGDEFLSYFPELEDMFREISRNLRGLSRYLERCSSYGLNSLPILDLDRLSKKMRRDQCTADMLLREMRIQDLEAAMGTFDSLPADALAKLSTDDRGVDRAVAGCHPCKAMGHKQDVDAPAHAAQTDVQSQVHSAGEDNYHPALSQKAANRFAALDGDSNDGSDCDE